MADSPSAILPSFSHEKLLISGYIYKFFPVSALRCQFHAVRTICVRLLKPGDQASADLANPISATR